MPTANNFRFTEITISILQVPGRFLGHDFCGSSIGVITSIGEPSGHFLYIFFFFYILTTANSQKSQNQNPAMKKKKKLQENRSESIKKLGFPQVCAVSCKNIFSDEPQTESCRENNFIPKPHIPQKNQNLEPIPIYQC